MGNLCNAQKSQSQHGNEFLWLPGSALDKFVWRVPDFDILVSQKPSSSSCCLKCLIAMKNGIVKEQHAQSSQNENKPRTNELHLLIDQRQHPSINASVEIQNSNVSLDAKTMESIYSLNSIMEKILEQLGEEDAYKHLFEQNVFQRIIDVFMDNVSFSTQVLYFMRHSQNSDIAEQRAEKDPKKEIIKAVANVTSQLPYKSWYNLRYTEEASEFIKFFIGVMSFALNCKFNQLKIAHEMGTDNFNQSNDLHKKIYNRQAYLTLDQLLAFKAINQEEQYQHKANLISTVTEKANDQSLHHQSDSITTNAKKTKEQPYFFNEFLTFNSKSDKLDILTKNLSQTMTSAQTKQFTLNGIADAKANIQLEIKKGRVKLFHINSKHAKSVENIITGPLVEQKKGDSQQDEECIIFPIQYPMFFQEVYQLKGAMRNEFVLKMFTYEEMEIIAINDKQIGQGDLLALLTMKKQEGEAARIVFSENSTYQDL